ncbi:MAG: glycosyltransferase, partial [Chloroflexia bacterium]|nr:glycosyltransferase [Chloroflexia bacterium]
MIRTHPTQNVAPRREVILTLVCFVGTFFFLTMVIRHLAQVGSQEWANNQIASKALFVAFVAIILSLLYGVLVFFLSRLGYYQRLSRFDPARHQPRLTTPDADPLPSLTILVPSYKEDADTIRQTLLSAALQDYPDHRVVLLLDDPPSPRDPEDRILLASARATPNAIRSLLEEPLREARMAAAAFGRRSAVRFEPTVEIDHLVDAYAAASRWFVAQVAEPGGADHVDTLFRALVFDTHREHLQVAIQDVQTRKAQGGMPSSDIGMHYARLIQMFDVQVTVFERKRYANLSQEVNKAANLNSCIGLLGRTVREVRVGPEVHLVACEPDALGARHIPSADFVVTLDADSILSPDYARRLVAVMQSPGNERVAVVQTPYSAIPGAKSVIERVAGATTDIQYIVHQGFTWLGATFWVGANALLRMSALEDIRQVERERGHEVVKYIQDRTVIEDTESSIDLVARGWRLHNEPMRLAYSATPPDFGSFLIQRRRWATGGLLILPKLAGYAFGRQWNRIGFVELFARIHYLASPALAGIGLLLLLVLP